LHHLASTVFAVRSFTGQANVTGNAFLAGTPEAFGYDLDGNLTSDGRWTYTWDAARNGPERQRQLLRIRLFDQIAFSHLTAHTNG